jgi:ribosomal protein S4
MSKNKTRKYRNISLSAVPHCMDVEGGNLEEDARVVSFPCHSGPNQKFRYNKKTKQIVSKHSRKCVDLDLVKNRLYQKTCSVAKKTQKWRKKRNQYQWISLANHKCIKAENVSDKYGSKHLITTSCK